MYNKLMNEKLFCKFDIIKTEGRYYFKNLVKA